MNSYNCKYIYKYYKKQGGTLAYDIFKKIISENNKAVSIEIMNGYHYIIPHKIGMIRIVLNKRKITITDNGTIKGAVNWGESNKLKDRLISEGKTLYECTKDKEGKIISDNGGEKWLVYFTDKYYPLWIMVSGVFLHNAINYDFSPTWTNERALKFNMTEDSQILYKEKADGTNRNYLSKVLTSAGRGYARDREL